MAENEDISLGSITKKGLSFLNSKLNEAIENTAAIQEKVAKSSTLPSVPALQNVEAAADTSRVACCHSCGQQLTPGAKFCPECGASQSGDYPAPSGNPVSIPSGGQTKRESVYEGAIHKCPSCGAPIDPIDAVCDSCGYRIANRNASSTVQQFYMELAALEKTRKKKGLFRANGELDVVDKQKISLINTFPVPNTIGELSEFMFMTSESINVEKSKQRSSFAKFWTAADADPEKAVSDAWVAKMKQVYNKAKLSFPDDPVFAHIEQVYSAKMAELGMN